MIGEPSEVFRKPNSKFTAEFLGVTNIFRGESSVDNGMAYIDINGLRVTSTDTGRVRFISLSGRKISWYL